MKINKLHLLWNVAALLLCAGIASCSQDEPGMEQERLLPPGKYPLTLTASVEGIKNRSVGKDAWTDGDEIGVRIGTADGVTGRYRLDGDGYVQETVKPVYWQNTAKTTVCAWYPYAEGEQTYDISNQSKGYAALDFLYAEIEGSYTASVLLAFSHQMAKVSYTLVKGQGITDAELDAAAVTLSGDESVTVSSGKIVGTATSQNDEITPCHDAATHTGSVVVVPQDMTGTPLIKVSINGKDFIYTPATEDAGNLQAGYHYSYTIIVKADGIEVTEAKGGEWTEGGNENVTSKEVKQAFTASDLKPGDFFYSDGTHGDGGLRTIYTDGTYRIDATVVPDLEKTCIGIVFHAGQHETDQSDYTATGIEQAKCHGYVVALTDVHNDSGDLHRWEHGPTNEYNIFVGTSTSPDDWNGYSNSQKFHEFVDDEKNKTGGWEMKHFPAALACETYGNLTLDQDGKPAGGKYDWQQPLAAPSNTSGWFLPSCGQLRNFYQNRPFLSARMDFIKNITPNSRSYKNYIKWFSMWNYYWSSSEYLEDYPDYAWCVRFDDGFGRNYYKNYTNEVSVRAVLAF